MTKFKHHKSEAEWKKELSSEQFHILRQKGTERPFSGQYNNLYDKGLYHCAGCNETLFESESKFDSGCGWPSFDASINNKISYVLDKSHGMIRTEILCSACGGHLGHVFNDGPTPSGTRYCVNSLSLDFKKS